MTKYNFDGDIKKMIEKYVAGKATAEEIRFVESYYDHLKLDDTVDLTEDEITHLRESGFEQITANIQSQKSGISGWFNFYKYAAAAAILLFSISGYLVFEYYHKQKPDYVSQVKSPKKPDVAPGTNKATLTLAGGVKIILDDTKNGELTQMHGISIVKTKSGQLVYSVLQKQATNALIANNTIETPKGGQYQVVLPDGTKVWLNAASSLTYPELFTGGKREVKLEGEAYFEVAKNKAMPFHVITKSQDVEVTGTHFNINAYMDDQSINTTLLEGGVTIQSFGKIQKLLPGQQSMVYMGSSSIKVRTVNTDDEVAWKNGLFQFNNLGLKNIMNQLERWYNIRVDYSSLPLKRYNGMVPRNVPLSEVLTMLELTGNIRFEILENRQIKVIGGSSKKREAMQSSK